MPVASPILIIMAQPAAQSCSTCQFYFPDGTCHWYPPNLTLHASPQGPVLIIWPSAAPADWCGQWAKITP